MMSVYNQLFLICTSFLFFFNAKYSKKIFNTHGLIILWWGGWSLLAGLDLGLATVAFPNAIVNYSVLIFCLGLSFGHFSYDQGKIRTRPDNFMLNDLHYYKFMKVVCFFLILPMIFTTLYLTIKTLSHPSFSDIGLLGIRSEFFKMSDGRNYWFPSQIIYAIYSIFSGVAFHVLLLTAFVTLFLNNQKKLFILLVTVITLDLILKGSRGALYSLILCSGFLMYFLKNKISLSRTKIKVILVTSFSIIILLVGTTILRKARVVEQVVNYHTVGFTLFSKLIENNQYYVANELSYGRRMIGGLDYFLTIALRGLGDKKFSSPAHSEVFFQSQPIVTGSHLSAQGVNSFIEHNFFYTQLISPYMDFGLIGVLLVGVIIGHFLKHFELSFQKNGDLMSLTWILFIFYNNAMGIFGATFETVGFWAVLILLIFMTNYVECTSQKMIGNKKELG